MPRCAFTCKFAVLLLSLLLTAGPAAAGAETVVCTTTHLSALVDVLGGGKLRSETIIAWGMCPGHFELKRGDIEKLRRADLVLRHGMERFLTPFEEREQGAPIVTVAVAGNWLIPALQQQAAEEAAVILAERFPALADEINVNLARHREQVADLERELQPLVRKFHGVPVICSVMSAELAAWLGLNVAGEFRRDEDLSLRNMQEALSRARRARARAVIDNYQSSGKVGRTLARQLNLPLVVFSNFPAPPPEGGSGYATTLRGNLRALADAL